jgi:DNA-binding CsgD family transcriptional regulator
VSPLQPGDATGRRSGGAGALVLVRDPADLPTLSGDALHGLYGLTPAEARVATRIARGQTVGSIAGSLGVRRATVRTQLQQALLKTGTHRQADLVRLLLAGTTGLAAEDAAPTAAGSRPSRRGHNCALPRHIPRRGGGTRSSSPGTPQDAQPPEGVHP